MRVREEREKKIVEKKLAYMETRSAREDDGRGGKKKHT